MSNQQYGHTNYFIRGLSRLQKTIFLVLIVVGILFTSEGKKGGNKGKTKPVTLHRSVKGFHQRKPLIGGKKSRADVDARCKDLGCKIGVVAQSSMQSERWSILRCRGCHVQKVKDTDAFCGSMSIPEPELILSGELKSSASPAVLVKKVKKPKKTKKTKKTKREKGGKDEESSGLEWGGGEDDYGDDDDTEEGESFIDTTANGIARGSVGGVDTLQNRYGLGDDRYGVDDSDEVAFLSVGVKKGSDDDDDDDGDDDDEDDGEEDDDDGDDDSGDGDGGDDDESGGGEEEGKELLGAVGFKEKDNWTIEPRGGSKSFGECVEYDNDKIYTVIRIFVQLSKNPKFRTLLKNKDRSKAPPTGPTLATYQAKASESEFAGEELQTTQFRGKLHQRDILEIQLRVPMKSDTVMTMDEREVEKRIIDEFGFEFGCLNKKGCFTNLYATCVKVACQSKRPTWTSQNVKLMKEKEISSKINEGLAKQAYQVLRLKAQLESKRAKATAAAAKAIPAKPSPPKALPAPPPMSMRAPQIYSAAPHLPLPSGRGVTAISPPTIRAMEQGAAAKVVAGTAALQTQYAMPMQYMHPMHPRPRMNMPPHYTVRNPQPNPSYRRY